MADKFMHVPNDDTQNNPFCNLHLVVETFETTNQNSIKVSKFVDPMKKKKFYKTFWN